MFTSLWGHLKNLQTSCVTLSLLVVYWPITDAILRGHGSGQCDLNCERAATWLVERRSLGGHCVCGQNDEDFVSDVVKQFCDALTSQYFTANELSFWFKAWDRTGDCWKLSMSVAIGKWTFLSSKFVVYMGLVIWSSLVRRLCQPESFRCWLMLAWD